MEKDTFSIMQVSEMTGVSQNRIREWHEKGLLPQVERIPQQLDRQLCQSLPQPPIRKYSIRSKDAQDQRIDPGDPRNREKLIWMDKDNQRDDPDYQPEIVFDATNPENLLIAKEIAQFACAHFSRIEIDYIMGEIDLMEAASISGITGDAFRKRIDRRRADFLKAMQAIDMI